MKLVFNTELLTVALSIGVSLGLISFIVLLLSNKKSKQTKKLTYKVIVFESVVNALLGFVFTFGFVALYYAFDGLIKSI